MPSSWFRFLRKIAIFVCHLTIVAFSLLVAFLLRFDFVIPPGELQNLRLALPIAVATKMAIFAVGGLHRGWWLMAGLTDLVRVFFANAIGTLLFWAVAYFTIGAGFPRSVIVIDFILCFLLSSGARFAVRLYTEIAFKRFRPAGSRNILIYGAGKAAVMLLQEFRRHPELGQVLGLIDDDREKLGMEMGGVKVLGTGRDLVHHVERLKRSGGLDEVIIAMPSASGKQIRDAVAAARSTGIRCKIMPGISDLIARKVLTSQIRDVSLEDLLGREPVDLEERKIQMGLAGKCVVVTGGAGSIGSELCRQIALYVPAKLIVFDQSENDLYRIDMELRNTHQHLEIIPVVGDIRDASRVDSLFASHRVDFVFHAAAYKHVPMMEINAREAIFNNVIGTYTLTAAARKYRVANFLMISSDKAVNPTNVMGLTKRIAELVVSTMPDNGGETVFNSVRFGNVLGTNGSVVPLFRQQIAAGGPVTVTHPDMRRFFMTVREAVQLVLQASTMGRGSEIFVLEMGEMVKILDLARNMIRLSGFEPDEDIEIRFVGLRPGEKLFEELSGKGEELVDTYHSKIRVFQGSLPSHEKIEAWVKQLRILLESADEATLLDHMAILAPEYSGRHRVAGKGPRSEQPARLGAASAG